MVQINTPYPATAYLKGFLDAHATGVVTVQADPALELVLRLFSRDGLVRVRESMKPDVIAVNAELQFFLEAHRDYEGTVADAVLYLQGKAPELTQRIAARDLLPEGPRFVPLQSPGPLLDQFLALPDADRAQHV
ncbi:hypothetical protein, partial [Staphylococcus epidermidis]|uniref:hypothetical protein n=1 Tax=Staphylococcus epidermidis TaxID=1282 RepID=UPI00273A08EC